MWNFKGGADVMLALIVTCIGLLIYCFIAESRIKKANQRITELCDTLRKEGISSE